MMDAIGSADLEAADTPDSEARSAPPAAIAFEIEPIAGGRLKGWIVDPADASRAMVFDLLVGRASVGRFIADQPSPPAPARYGGGRHGFSLVVRPEWRIGSRHDVALKLASGEMLSVSKTRVAAPAIPVDAPDVVIPFPSPASSEDKATGRLIGAIHALRGGDVSAAMLVREHLEERIVRPLARAAHAEKRWRDVIALGSLLAPSPGGAFDLVQLVAHAHLIEDEPAAAHVLLAAHAEANEANGEWLRLLSLALAKLNRVTEALPPIRQAVEINPRSMLYRRTLAATLVRLVRSGQHRPEARVEILEEALAEYEAAAALVRRPPSAVLLPAAQILVDLGRFPEALDRVELVLAKEPDRIAALIAKSRALIALGDIAGALVIARRVLALQPDHQTALYQVRTLEAAADEFTVEAEPRIAMFGLDGAGLIASLTGFDGEPVPLPDVVAKLEFGGAGDWLVIAENAVDRRELVIALKAAPPWCGRFEVARGAVDTPLVAWRGELLVALAQSGLIERTETLPEALTGLASIVASAGGSAPPIARDPSPRNGPAICMSRHGVHRFGGGEAFLDSMADHYQALGHEPIIVGARSGQVIESGIADGRRFAAIDGSVDAIRRFVVEQRPAVVHVLSGLGFEVAHALRYLDVPFIYGVHFWRDCLGATEGTDRYFANGDRDPIARKTFAMVIERAAAVYSNSVYTRGVLEQAFGIRTPIVYSLPRADWPADDRGARLALTHGKEDYVLLLNARMDKGFGLIVETATRLPHVPFIAVASQSDRDEAVRFAAARGATNVLVIDKTDRPDLLYRGALAAAVPSYQFVETFSRVCIEAQRFGCPVIGSDKGNVPLLLAQSGIALREDPDLWAAEIDRLVRDADYRALRRSGAAENSARYAYPVQQRAHALLAPKLARRILVAIGSGIGNMLHTGPMLRAMARHFGQPLDIVVAEDHSESLFLLQDPAVVSEVFAFGRAPVRRRYDLVFVTSCFGNIRPPFAGRRVVYARDWQAFSPEGPLHEAHYNLEAARQMLGVDYDEADIAQAYVGDLAYAPPAEPRLIGFHGGSKDLFWTSKRWPHFPALGERLRARGWEVASFGTPGEYVEGTIDRTGGSIEAMAQAMRDCAYFVTNDSGVMNVANALGIPLTALFAPTNPATRAPLRDTSTWLAVEKDCAPCEVTLAGRGIFQSGNCRCIAELALDRVDTHVSAHMAGLGLFPPGE